MAHITAHIQVNGYMPQNLNKHYILLLQTFFNIMLVRMSDEPSYQNLHCLPSILWILNMNETFSEILQM